MELSALISEQEQNLRQASMFGVVPDPVPGVQSPVAPDYDAEMVREMLDLISAAHTEVEEEFDTVLVDNAWRRRAVQEFMASEQMRRLENAVEEQACRVMRESRPDLRAEAYKKVKEGIEYWKGLILWNIRRK